MHQWPPSWQDLDSVVLVLSLFLSQDQNDQHAEKTKANLKLRVSPCRSILPQPSKTRRKVNSFDSRCHRSSAVKIHARFHSNAIGPTNCTVQTGLCIKIANFSRCECSEEVPLSGKRLLLLETKHCQAKRKKSLGRATITNLQMFFDVFTIVSMSS